MKYKVLTFHIDTNADFRIMEDRQKMEEELNKWAEDGWQVCMMLTNPRYHIGNYDLSNNDHSIAIHSSASHSGR